MILVGGLGVTFGWMTAVNADSWDRDLMRSIARDIQSMCIRGLFWLKVMGVHIGTMIGGNMTGRGFDKDLLIMMHFRRQSDCNF